MKKISHLSSSYCKSLLKLKEGLKFIMSHLKPSSSSSISGLCMVLWLEVGIVTEEYQGISHGPWIPESRTGAVTPTLETELLCLNKHSREE